MVQLKCSHLDLGACLVTAFSRNLKPNSPAWRERRSAFFFFSTQYSAQAPCGFLAGNAYYFPVIYMYYSESRAQFFSPIALLEKIFIPFLKCSCRSFYHMRLSVFLLMIPLANLLYCQYKLKHTGSN